MKKGKKNIICIVDKTLQLALYFRTNMSRCWRSVAVVAFAGPGLIRCRCRVAASHVLKIDTCLILSCFFFSLVEWIILPPQPWPPVLLKFLACAEGVLLTTCPLKTRVRLIRI
jgi:hypothetical protein